MELIIIRHGLPLRVEKKDNTPADPALSETGIEQAKKLSCWLKSEKIDAIYCSPMQRARLTAEPLAESKGIQVIIEPGVAEFDMDSSVYIPMEELKKIDYPQWRKFMEEGFAGAFEIEAFSKKVLTSLNRIIAENKGKRVAVVCHGGIINIFAAHILGTKKHLFFAPDYTSINRFMIASAGSKSVICLNEAAHLREDISFG